MKLLSLAFVFLASASAYGHTTCYQVSKSPTAWSKTPELLCIEEVNPEEGVHKITLEVGMAGNRMTLATFENLALTSAAKCIDCNLNLYSPADHVASRVFSDVTVKFQGVRDTKTFKEVGSIKVLGVDYYYRSL